MAQNGKGATQIERAGKSTDRAVDYKALRSGAQTSMGKLPSLSMSASNLRPNVTYQSLRIEDKAITRELKQQENQSVLLYAWMDTDDFEYNFTRRFSKTKRLVAGHQSNAQPTAAKLFGGIQPRGMQVRRVNASSVSTSEHREQRHEDLFNSHNDAIASSGLLPVLNKSGSQSIFDWGLYKPRSLIQPEYQDIKFSNPRLQQTVSQLSDKKQSPFKEFSTSQILDDNVNKQGSHQEVQINKHSRSLMGPFRNKASSSQYSEPSLGPVDQASSESKAGQKLNHSFKLNAPLYQRFRALGTNVHRQMQQERRERGKRELLALGALQRRIQMSNQYNSHRHTQQRGSRVHTPSKEALDSSCGLNQQQKPSVMLGSLLQPDSNSVDPGTLQGSSSSQHLHLQIINCNDNTSQAIASSVQQVRDDQPLDSSHLTLQEEPIQVNQVQDNDRDKQDEQPSSPQASSCQEIQVNHNRSQTSFANSLAPAEERARKVLKDMHALQVWRRDRRRAKSKVSCQVLRKIKSNNETSGRDLFNDGSQSEERFKIVVPKKVLRKIGEASDQTLVQESYQYHKRKNSKPLIMKQPTKNAGKTTRFFKNRLFEAYEDLVSQTRSLSNLRHSSPLAAPAHEDDNSDLAESKPAKMNLFSRLSNQEEEWAKEQLKRKIKNARRVYELKRSQQDFVDDFKKKLLQRDETIKQYMENQFLTILPEDRPLQRLDSNDSAEIERIIASSRDVAGQLYDDCQLQTMQELEQDLRAKVYKYGIPRKDYHNTGSSAVKPLDLQEVRNHHVRDLKKVKKFINANGKLFQGLDEKQKQNLLKKITRALYSKANEPNSKLFKKGSVDTKIKDQQLKKALDEFLEDDKREAAARRVKFKEWQEEMWARLHHNRRMREISERPNYHELYGQAAEKYLSPFKEELKVKAIGEQQVLESVWREQRGVADFRGALKAVFKAPETEADFFHHLLVVEDEEDRQKKFFAQTQSFKFLEDKDQKKSLRDAILDGDVPLVEDQETVQEKKFVNELMNIRNKTEYRQKGLGELYRQKEHLSTAQDKELAIQKQFAQRCIQNNALPVSTLIIVPSVKTDNKYVIIDEPITEQQLQSLSETYPNTNMKVSQIYFSKNKLKGKSFAQLLKSLTQNQRKSVQSLVYGGANELTAEVLQTISEDYLFQLKELKLIGLQILKPLGLPQFLSSLETDMKLRSLTLSKLNLGMSSAEQLAAMLADMPVFLKELDLSYNKFTSKGTSLICKNLKGNNNIEYLNLAFNLVEASDPLSAFGSFLRTNQHLMHLNISGVLQTANQVTRVIKRIKKSQSLLAIHLSYTPIIVQDQTLQQYIAAKLQLHIMHQEDNRIKDENPEQKEEDKPIRYTKPAQVERYGWKDKYRMVAKAKTQLSLHNYFRHLDAAEEPAIHSNSINQNFVLQRTVGHSEIIANKIWLKLKSCYICNRDRYTLFLSNQPDVSIMGTFDLLYSVKKIHIKLVDIREFARSLVEVTGSDEHDRREYTKLLPLDVQSQLKKDRGAIRRFETRWTRKDITLYQDHNVWLAALQRNLLEQDYQFIHHLRDDFSFESHAHIVEYGTDPKLYVHADYMKYHPRIERIKFIDSASNKVLHKSTFLQELRDKNVPLQVLDKVIKEKKKNIPFDLNKSVFKAWQRDTPQILKNALTHDFEYWKGGKILKDKQVMQEIMDCIKDNYTRIKHIFITLMAADQYPFIGWIDFCNFCKVVGIYDSVITAPVVDNMFFATKFNPQPGGEGRQLFRHEFLEILVRLALQKFWQTGKAVSQKVALQMLLDQIFTRFETKPWQEFRDSELWTNEIDKLLKTNHESLKTLHSKLCPRQQEYGHGILKTCIDLLVKTPGVLLTDKEARYCFGMSKMTVTNEVLHLQEYFHLRLPEFYEFLGRAAFAKYVDQTSMPLYQKLEAIMKVIFLDQHLKFIKARDDEVDDNITSEDSVTGVAVTSSLFENDVVQQFTKE